ncbi:LytTR family transcriptional regulator [Flavihumibacter sediminis]|nr:LytTR family transcriptional regulator [Flavihumibacter sediminis]
MNPEEILVRTGDKWQVLRIADIRYIKADNKVCRVITIHREHILTTPLQVLENDLPADRFFRVHRCYLVAWSHITALTTNGICVGSEELPVSRNVLPDLNSRYAMRYY